MACIVTSSIEEKKDLHNTIVKLRKSLYKDIKKDNSNKTDEDINDLVALVLEDNGIENRTLEDEKYYTVTRNNINAGNSSKVNIYGIEAFKGGYKILYVTPGTNTAKVVRVASNGRTASGMYNINTIKDRFQKFNKQIVTAKKEITEEKASYEQTIISFGSDKESSIEFTGDNIEIINAQLINDTARSEEVLNELFEIDNVKLEPEHVSMLRETLRNITSLTKKVIPDMIQHINKSTEKNYGRIELEDSEVGPRGIYIGVSGGLQTAGNAMSASEAYVHEMMHAALEYAQRDKRDIIVNTMNDINAVYAQFLDVITEEDFMPDIKKSIDRTEERKIAKARIEYLRDEKVGLNEFIVMAQTNMIVQKVLNDRVVTHGNKKAGRTLFQKLIALIQNVYESIYIVVRGDSKNINGAMAMAKYIKELSASNNMAITEIAHKNAFIEAFNKFMNFMNTKGATHLNKMMKKMQKLMNTEDGDQFEKDLADFNTNNKNYSKLEKTLFHIKMLGRFLTNSTPENIGAFETWLELMGLPPEGTIQQLVRVFRNSDGLETIVESLGLVSGKVEYAVETALASQSKVIKELFGGKIEPEDSIAMTKVILDIELDSLIDEHLDGSKTEQFNKIKEIITDNEKIDLEISKTRDKLGGMIGKVATTNFVINQTIGLGKYMVTGEANKSQLMNSYNIIGMSEFDDDAKSISIINARETSPMIRAEIDKLATLEALKISDEVTRKRVSKILDANADAVIGLMNYNKMIEQQFLDQDAGTENSHKINRVKGQHEKINSNWITDKIALKSDEAKMRKQNYTLVPNASFNGEYGLYINTDYTEPGWRQEGIRTTNDSVKTNSLMQAIKESNLPEKADMYEPEQAKRLKKIVDKELAVLSKEVFDEMKKMRSKNYKAGSEGMRPVFSVNRKGEMFVTDMDISIDKSMFENAMRTKNNVDAVLGKSYARGIDLKNSKDNNMNILKVIQQDMYDNYDDSLDYYHGGKKNLMSYVKIGPDEDNKLSNEIWSILPRYLKVKIIKDNGDNIQRQVAEIAKSANFTDNTTVWSKKANKLKKELDALNKDRTSTVDKILEKEKELSQELFRKVYEYRNRLKDGKEKDLLNKKISKIVATKPYIAVRRNLVYHYFGNRETSLLDYTDKKTLNRAITIIKKMDMIWKHIVKIIKTNIVLRDLPVLVMNIISNVLLAVIQGRNPLEEIKQQMTGILNLHKYKEDNRRIQQLKLKIASKNQTAGDENELKILVNAINTNPVKPLIDAGLYTSATEDLSNEDLHKETYMDMQQEKVLGKIPDGVRSVLNAVYLTKDTPVFHGLLLAMQYSDFGARYSKYYQMKSEGASEEEAIKSSLDNQINYGFGSGKLIQWANARGAVLFTKFYEAIQRVVKNLSLDKPFNVFLAALSGGFLLEDSPLGDSILMRSPMGLFNNPLDVAAVLFEKPALFQILTGDYN